MNTKKIRWMAAGLIAIVTLVVFCSGFTTPPMLTDPIEPEIAKDILNNTVQIRMFAPLPSNGQTDNQTFVMAQGLGSLALWQGKNIIVTHNHWGAMLEDAEYAQILDTQGRMLLKLGIVELKALILYRDPGTMILAAPVGHPAGSTLDEQISMQTGDVVTLVHQAADDPNRINLLQAKVVYSKNYKGQLVYKLAIADDGKIIPGDSGGGIWLDGKLMGNMWASYLNTIKLPLSSSTSLAAPLPSLHLQADENAGSVSVMRYSSDVQSGNAIAK
jgi:hypothetical protein